jgi:transcriptional regulator with XRE-family HTH domain
MSHWVARFNVPGEVDFDVLEESALAMAQSKIQNAINAANISRADLARRMRCNRSVISRILGGNHNLTVKTMARALAACGSEIRFETVPIEWNWTSTPSNEGLTAHAVSTMPTPFHSCFCEFIGGHRTDRMSISIEDIGEKFDSSYC